MSSTQNITSNILSISFTNRQSHTNKFFIIVIYHHYISLLVNLHVGHLIGQLVNLHDQHHNLSNTSSISIINYQSLVSKVLSRYLHSPGSHQSTRFSSVTHWLTDSLTLSLQERLVTLKIIERFRVALDSIHNLCNVHIKKNKFHLGNDFLHFYLWNSLFAGEGGSWISNPSDLCAWKKWKFFPNKIAKSKGRGVV